MINYRDNKKRSFTPAFLRRFIDFFYEWHYPRPIRYGGGPQGYRTFRWERFFIVLANVFLLIIVALIAFNKI
jgi:hypothetical protein